MNLGVYAAYKCKLDTFGFERGFSVLVWRLGTVGFTQVLVVKHNSIGKETMSKDS
jgi:hypothetical protein